MSHRGGCVALRQLNPSWVNHPKDLLRGEKPHYKCFTFKELEDILSRSFEFMSLFLWIHSICHLARKNTKLEELFHFLFHSKLIYPKTTSSQTGNTLAFLAKFFFWMHGFRKMHETGHFKLRSFTGLRKFNRRFARSPCESSTEWAYPGGNLWGWKRKEFILKHK